MKGIVFKIMFVFSLFAVNCDAGNTGNADNRVINLTDVTFQQKVFNYEMNTQWKYEGKIPAVIDFYADWCAPCRKMSPVIEEIANEFAGKIVVYKVNTDIEQKLSQSLGISSLPTLLFIPVNGKPQASVGALTKEVLVKTIQDVLLNK